MKKMSVFLILSILYYGCKPQTINKIEQSKEVVKRTPELASTIQFPPNTKFIEKNVNGVKSVEFILPEGFYMVLTDVTGLELGQRLKDTGIGGGEIKCSCSQPKDGSCNPFLDLGSQTMGCIKDGCTTCKGTINGRVMGDEVKVDIRIGRLKDFEVVQEMRKTEKERRAAREKLSERLGTNKTKKESQEKALILPILSYTEMLKMEVADVATLKDPAVKKELAEIKAMFLRGCDKCPQARVKSIQNGELPEGFVLVPVAIKGKKTFIVAPYEGVLGSEYAPLLPTSFKGGESRASYPPSGMPIKYRCTPSCCTLYTETNGDGEIDFVQCKNCSECTLYF
jgi:hypothetical protein